jgi:hypothetical protein
MKNMTWQNPMLGCGLWLHDSFLCVLNKGQDLQNLRWQILALVYELWFAQQLFLMCHGQVSSFETLMWHGVDLGCPTISYMSLQVSHLEF